MYQLKKADHYGEINRYINKPTEKATNAVVQTLPAKLIFTTSCPGAICQCNSRLIVTGHNHISVCKLSIVETMGRYTLVVNVSVGVSACLVCRPQSELTAGRHDEVFLSVFLAKHLSVWYSATWTCVCVKQISVSVSASTPKSV